jgi:anti-sigma B factor antagonist
MEPSRVQCDVRALPDGRVVVHLAGELDMAEADAVRRLLTAQAERSPLVAVDLAGLTFIDLAGVRAIHAAQRAANADGSTFVVVSPPRCVIRLVDLLDLGPMPFSDDRSIVEEPRSCADGRRRAGRAPARRRRMDGAGAR